MEKNKSLFEIDEQILRLITLEDSDIIDEETGEVLIDLEEELNKLLVAHEEKILNIARYIDTLNRERVLLKEKADALSARAKSKENRANRLKAYVLNSMVNLGATKVEDETVVVRLNSREVVNVVDESKIPEEYFTKKIEVKPDKRRLLSDLKKGIEIGGVEIGESKSITVR